ncbi:MAG: hypothetical protein QOD77_914 [Thermoplasmata archaeon]|jgi:membrane-associated phospholipid phosphatase|nr:hypothetical protein [Thermoplasmata archaeon]
MEASIGATLVTVAILLFGALPLSAALTLLLFFPLRGWVWGRAHAARVLHRHGIALVALVAMLVPENLESWIDPEVTAMLPWRDAPTAFIASYEGGFHAWLQALPGQTFLLPVLAVVYLAGFPYIIIAAVVHGVWRDDGARARQAAAAYALCFAIALPFYLLVPVDEVWHHFGPGNDGPVRQLAMQQYPLVRDHLYAFNEVNNCLPSLHTAISVAMALIVRGTPRFGRFAAVLAGLIVASTMYLGIHWVTDVVAGLGLAWLAVFLARRFYPAQETLPVEATAEASSDGL